VGKKKTKNISIIDQDMDIEGTLSSTGKLIIRGRFSGTIDADTVIIAKGGQVTSTGSRVSSMTIGGNFAGELSVSKELIVLSSGICSGNVECHDLVVENGGVLNARVICKAAAELTETLEKHQ
jgi:cytoskeletal protein CcmA (bactofilin family)